MSYKQAMKWARKHPKGTRQPVLMHTNSGFWPSKAFLDDYWKYCAACEAISNMPLECQAYYTATMRGGAMCSMNMQERARYTTSPAASDSNQPIMRT